MLDTDTGPNFIREGCCPPEALARIDKTREFVKLASATQHRLHVLRIVMLTVTIGTYSARFPFVGVRNLGDYILLGCAFQDRHVENIRCRRRDVIMANGDVVPIIIRQAMAPTH